MVGGSLGGWILRSRNFGGLGNSLSSFAIFFMIDGAKCPPMTERNTNTPKKK